jgi:hypothetical protein
MVAAAVVSGMVGWAVNALAAIGELLGEIRSELTRTRLAAEEREEAMRASLRAIQSNTMVLRLAEERVHPPFEDTWLALDVKKD